MVPQTGLGFLRLRGGFSQTGLKPSRTDIGLKKRKKLARGALVLQNRFEYIM